VNRLRKIFAGKILSGFAISVAVAVFAAAVGVVYSFVMHGIVIAQYVFTAGFVASTLVVAGGLTIFFKPVRLGNNKFTDHNNYAQMVMDEREEKRARAFEIIYIGLGAFAVTAAGEYLVFLIMR